MSYNTDLQNNNVNLQSILDKVNALPEADNGDDYVFPVATETTLGGVKAPAKTEDMTQPVGVDSEGFLFVTPAEKVNIPTALPNPHALTFTGAVEGTYDGSEPLKVEIPEGGSGGEKRLRLIADVTIDTTNLPEGGIIIDKDLDGNPFEIRRAFIQTDLTSNVSYLAIGINGLAWTYDLHFDHSIEPKYVEYHDDWMIGLSSGRMRTNIAGGPLPSGGGVANARNFGAAKSFQITATLTKGTYLKIWEVLD